MKNKIKKLIGNKRVVKIIKTLTLVMVICVNSIIVLSKNDDGTINAAEFQIRQEQSVNAAEFNLIGGR